MATTTKTSPASKTVQTAEKKVQPLQEFFTKFGNDWAMNFAGMLAYNLLASMLPIAIAIVSILGLILGTFDANAKQNIITQLGNVFPDAASKSAISLAINQLTKDAGILALIAILLAIFGGSRLFITIEGCLDIIYRVRPRPVLGQNMMAIGMLLLFIILIPIMVLASAAPTFVLSLLKFIPFLAHNGILITLSGILGGLLTSFILFEAIYVIVPNQRISWKNSWPGAAIAAVALEIFLTVFPLYTTRFLGGYVGQIGFAVILLLFFYYFAVILLLGAEINAFFFEKVRPIPNDLVTFVSTMAGKLNRDLPDIESPTHQNTKPTDSADDAHIADALKGERQTRESNRQKQQQIAAKARAQDKSKQEEKKALSRGPSKMTTIVEVVAGSVLAAVIELLRLRGRGR